jgi:hypothetical protein
MPISSFKLIDHPRWSCYKRLRRAVQLEMERSNMPTTDSAVDEYLQANLAAIFSDIKGLFHRDMKMAEITRSAQHRDPALHG